MLDPNIVEIIYHENAIVTFELAKEDLQLYDQFTEHKPVKKLVSGRVFKMDVEVRKFVASENIRRKHLILAEAIIARTSLGKAMSYIYLFFQNQAYPCKVFSSREKAIKWLIDQ